MVTRRLLQRPLEAYRVRGISQPLVRSVLRIEVRVRDRSFRGIDVRVDPGSGMTTLSAARAVDLGIPFPHKALMLTVETAAGPVTQRRHPVRIVVRIPGLDSREFDWPCHFLQASGNAPQPLLGLAGVLDDLRITFDGTYSPEAPYGRLILEELAAPLEV
jgi:hypothetical protein